MNAKTKSNEEAITGIQAMQGEGVHQSLGFWADAWSQVIKRPGAVYGLVWIGIVGFFAVFAPLLASGHPLVFRVTDDDGTVTTTYPIFTYLSSADWLLLLGTVIGMAWVLLPLRRSRWSRVGNMIWAGTQAALISVTVLIVAGLTGRRDAPDWVRSMEQWPHFVVTATAVISLIFTIIFAALPAVHGLTRRITLAVITGGIAWAVAAGTWSQPPETWSYARDIYAGKAEAIFTVVPWSPQQNLNDRDNKLAPPGARSNDSLARAVTVEATMIIDRDPATPLQKTDITAAINRLPLAAEDIERLQTVWAGIKDQDPLYRADIEAALAPELKKIGGHPFYLGTDSSGQDVMSQMLHASRLAISIGLVSTGIAVIIGVSIGAIMGYFGGLIDLVLYRIVEVFMAVPVLFLLIVAAGVLPPEMRSTYVMMAIIGVFTWHGAARFTRAEFLKLRNQDFVQSARAVGLPLPSILFRHMLPNGVAPVLVDASFLIAGAILFETILSYLGLGPPDQASWGRLLADATSDSGDFKWWLAIFPGLVIFLTVLAYNLIGEAFQMAIDPKLRKARV